MSENIEIPFGPASPKQEMMLESNATITIIGGAAGSGKSYVMGMHPYQHVGDPFFNAIYFRRTTVQVSGQGGLWDTAQEQASQMPVALKPKVRQKDLSLEFPVGAKVKFSHMEHVKDKFNHQGLQYTGIYFDEG